MKMGIVAKDVQKKDVVLMIMGLMGNKSGDMDTEHAKQIYY